MNIIMKCLAGSRAYGLETPEADYDWRGVFVAPTVTMLGVNRYRVPPTVDSREEDCVLHEVGKFFELALQANPNILEQLFSDDYVIHTLAWEAIAQARDIFLSKKVFKTYGGYAIAQMKKLQQREAQGLKGFNPRVKRRREKHARHCFRLLMQGKQLAETGNLNLRVEDPETLFEIERLPTVLMADAFNRQMEEFNAVVSPLPDHPNYWAANELLVHIRRTYA